MPPRAAATTQANTLVQSFGAPIKQYPGQIQVTRAVQVQVPGKHFNNLTGAEAAAGYWATAVEYHERHSFERHAKAWGAAHTGPGIRFVCTSDAIDDPDHKGFWTTLGLWNRWRHDTYKDDPEAEKQFLDELPAAPEAPDKPASAEKKKAEPEVRKHFAVSATGVHTVGGEGKLAGKQYPCTWYACLKPGCRRGAAKPIKQVGTATGDLFGHLDVCQPALAQQLRARSAHSPVRIGEDGEEYVMYSFDEMLPHHVRYVVKCFRNFDHFYETRADNGLLEYVQGFDKRATLPCDLTCHQILEVCHAWPTTPAPTMLLPCLS